MITYERYQSTSLYQDNSGNASGQGYLAFLLWNPGTDAPDELTIDQAWTGEVGFFLFLKESPGDSNLDTFISQVTAYLEQAAPSPSHSSFGWVQWDDSTASLGTVTLINAAPNASDPSATEIASGTSFDMGLFVMELGQYGPIVTAEENEENSIESFTFEYPPEADTPEPRQAFNITVPMSGQAKGTFQGQIAISDFSSSSQWNVFLNYVINDEGTLINQSYPLFAEQDESWTLLDFVIDPLDLVNEDRSYFQFTGQSFHLEDVDGTLTIVLDSDAALESAFRTIYGKTVYLAPLADTSQPAKLVYDYMLGTDGEKALYLSPSGDFEFQMEGGAIAELKQYQLLCGLSGAENFSFRPKSVGQDGDIMRFQAHQAAYAPKFPLIQEADTSLAIPVPARKISLEWKTLGKYQAALASTTGLLTDTYTTSWINVRPPESQETENLEIDSVPTYYSQPQDAALYDHAAVPSEVDVEDEILALRNTPAALFTSSVTQSLPMVPYAQTSPSGDLGARGLQDFEEQVIGPERREQVSGIDESLQTAGINLGDEMVQTTTPQGLIATVPSSGLSWDSVLLARSQSAATTYDLQFQNGVTSTLRNALQSNQLFLVATLAEPLGDFANEITIADWPFTFNVGSNGSGIGQYANVLIFKFASGSLEDRITEPSTWNQASTFNEDPDLVSFYLQTFIANTRINAESDSSYDNFLSIIANENWNGILALKVDVSVQNFPDDLKGLLAGIDRSEFFAHHIGIEINYVESTNGELSLPKSSMFGLIDYVDKGSGTNETLAAYEKSDPTINSLSSAESPVKFNESGEEVYGFTVLNLKILFANSDIKNYTSQVQFTTTAWFGATGTLNIDNNGNSLKQQTMLFNGAYESHDGVRTYTFATDPDLVYQYLLNSSVMGYLNVVKAQFNTLSSVPESDGSETISSQFLFWGYMNFNELPGFDLFSFGNESDDGATLNGLYFSGLSVDMDFVLNEDGSSTDPGFLLNPDAITFDNALSTPRADSVFNKFPIKVSGFLYSGQSGTSLADQGYQSVDLDPAETLETLPLGDEWYALVYDLNLGSMGALAAQAGFTATIATAWTPNTGAYQLYTGLKLPGVGGGQRTLSLQTVLNLSIDTITWQSIASAGNSADLAYLMTLDDIKLSILGKKIPGAGSTKFSLFGDPAGGDSTTLAWYAAYYDNSDE